MFTEKINEAQELLKHNEWIDKVEIRFDIKGNQYGSVFTAFTMVIQHNKYNDSGFDYHLTETGMFGRFMGNVELMKNGTGFYVIKAFFGQIIKQKIKFEHLEFKKKVSVAKILEKQEPISEKETANMPF
jgi:hypothetical protein